MAFPLSEEQQEVRREARDFAQREIRPVARELDENHEYPSEVISRAADEGLVATHLPEEYGGREMDSLSIAVSTEELCRGDLGVGYSLSSAGVGTHMIDSFGDEWMKEELFPGVTAGDVLTSLAITEPDHGSDAASMETTATRDGDEWVLDGTKKWVTNGPLADFSVVMAKTTPEGGHQGISVFLVPLDADGIDIEPITNMMGLHTAEVATVEFDEVRIPERNLIGEEDEGFYQLMYNFSAFTRLLASAQAVGVAQAALDAGKKYSREREQFGQAISDFQAVSHKLAEMRTDTEAARQLLYSSAQHIHENDTPDKAVVSMAKLFGSETAMDVVDKAMQIHGGNGYLTDYQVERYYRDARIIRIYEGSNEIQKEIISDSAF